MKKLSIIIAIMISTILILTTTVSALTLVLTTKTDKTEYKVGEKINLTTSWSEGMQAVDMILKYDASKVKFSSASISSTNYQDDGKGNLKISWYTDKDEDCKSMTFVFEAIAKGEANFSTDASELSFADGDLNQPDKYDASGMDKKVTIIEEKKQDEEPAGDKDPGAKPGPSGDKEPGNVPSGNNTSNPPADSSKAPGSMPYTGGKATLMLAIILSIGSICGYIQIKKYKQI